MQNNIRKILLSLQNSKPEIRGTTLITYIVSGSSDLLLASQHLSTEISTAQNIKSKQIRVSVINSLKNLQGSFKDHCKNGKIPPNGLVMLAGALDSKEEQYI